MRKLIPVLFAATACGGSSSSNSLSGAGSFSPNATSAIQLRLPDGTVSPYQIEVLLGSSTPAFNCGFLDAGTPASAIVHGAVFVDIANAPNLGPGTFSITDPNTFFNSTDIPPGGFAAVTVYGPTTPPSNSQDPTEASISGSLTLTKTGNEWAGTFTATMGILDGGAQAALSGSFDTSAICTN